MPGPSPWRDQHNVKSDGFVAQRGFRAQIKLRRLFDPDALAIRQGFGRVPLVVTGLDLDETKRAIGGSATRSISPAGVFTRRPMIR